MASSSALWDVWMDKLPEFSDTGAGNADVDAFGKLAPATGSTNIEFWASEELSRAVSS